MAFLEGKDRAVGVALNTIADQLDDLWAALKAGGIVRGKVN
jgi:hypothetical protein